MSAARILVIGANGQIGTELAAALAARPGVAAVVTSDLAPEGRLPGLTHEMLDVTDAAALRTVAQRHRITQVYHLAAALSASGEKHPQWAWNLNMGGLLNVLELARTVPLERVFWPSSIAAIVRPRTSPEVITAAVRSNPGPSPIHAATSEHAATSHSTTPPARFAS